MTICALIGCANCNASDNCGEVRVSSPVNNDSVFDQRASGFSARNERVSDESLRNE